ncbi:hypothetical protein BH11ARM2_BH11ARM2_34920 [soil metagenome]
MKKDEAHETAVRRLLERSDRHDDAPCVGERYAVRKMREDRHLPLEKARRLQAHQVEELLREECLCALETAKLTPRQIEVLGGRMDGSSLSELAGSRQSAQTVYKAALEKVGRAWRRNPYAGLAQVYRSEVNRGRH